MKPDDASRRLAAVLFADVVGYTALSSKDEDAAIRVVGVLQDISHAQAEEHGGRVVKFIGDAVMGEFPSTDAAVRAAIGLLEDFTAHEDVRAVDSTLSIGLHTGEVIGSEDGDIYGDGVNLASRLQDEAAPGRVFISQAVQAQLQQRQVFETRSVGRRAVKGLSRPIEVYEVAFAGGLPAPLPAVAPVVPSPTRQPQVSRSRAIAIGMGVGLVSFVALGVWNAAQSPGSRAVIPTSFSQVQLTFSGVAGSPRFSPDGSSVAVLDQPDAKGGSLMVLGSDGGSERAVAEQVAAFTWGADQQLVWSDASSGGTFSDDGTEAAQRISDKGWSTFLIDPRSGLATRIEKSQGGSVVVLQTLTADAADTLLALTDGTRIRQAAWSPGGDWLAATVTDTAGRASLRLLARDGSSTQTLLSQLVSHPRWAAEGNAVYFLGEVNGAVGIHLVQVHTRTGEPIGDPQSVMTGMNIEDFDVAENGSIAYTVQRRRENIWLVEPGEARAREQVTRGTAPVSSPALDASGERLAFVRNGDLYVSDADGAGAQQVTTLEGDISAVQWAPRRPTLAFIVQEPSERVLMVVSAEGGSPRRIPLANPLPLDLEPMLTWTGDGDAVVYVGADEMGWPGVLARVDLTTEVDTDLLRDSVGGGFLGLVASPDGSAIAVADAFGAIQLVSLRSREVAASYPDSPGQPVLWTADGRLVLRLMLDRRELRGLRPGETTTSELFRLPKGCRAITLNSDVTHGACSMLESFERDVWVAQPQFGSRAN